jgi:septal ring factor EnvC (AmiA/AmiB activator)
LRRNSGEGDLSALGEAGAMASGVLDWLRAAARGAEPDRAPLDRAAAWLAAQKTLYGDLVSPVSADRSLARTALADAEGRAAFLERTLAETREIVATLEGRIQALYDTIGSLDGQLGEMRDHIASLTRTNEDLRRHARSLETRLKVSQAAVREAAGRLESLVAPG